VDIVEYLELNVAPAGHKPGGVTKPRVEIMSRRWVDQRGLHTVFSYHYGGFSHLKQNGFRSTG